MKLTNRGWQLCLLALVIAALGRVLAIVELIVIGLSILALVGVSAAWIVSTRMRLRLQRSVNPTRVHAGDTAVVNLRVTNLGRRTPAFTITDFVTGTNGATLQTGPLRTAMTSQGSYLLPTSRRGRLEVGPAKVTVTDPLGIAEISLNVGKAANFVVYPKIVPLPAMTLATGPQALAASGKLHSLHRSGEDFYALRDYTVGDDPRRIHWRSTARLGRPMVREGEIARQNQLSVLLDTRADSYVGSNTGPNTSSNAGLSNNDAITKSFDTAVTVAASVIATTLRRGDAVRLVTTSGAVIGFASAEHSATEIFNHLAEVTLNELGALRPALNHLGGRDVGAVVVVVGPHQPDSATDLAVIAALSRQASSFVTLRAGGASPISTTSAAPTATAHGAMALADVADPSQLPAAWERACSLAGGSSVWSATGSAGPVGLGELTDGSLSGVSQ